MVLLQASGMSDYMVSRKRKHHAVDPCLGFHLLSSGNIISSPSSRSNHSPSFGFKAPAACKDVHEDTLVLPSIENKPRTEDICDASRNQQLENLPDYRLQRTAESPRRTQPENPGYENLNLSSNIAVTSIQLMMTVEDFLKGSSKRKGVVKKQYGRPKTRIKRLGDNGALFEAERPYGVWGSDASQDFIQLRSKKIRRATMYEPSSDEASSPNHKESSPLESKTRKTRGRILKSLKERLYEAAVLTHGHPDDILVHGATTVPELAPSRRPLRFIPNTQPELDESQIGKRRPRTWSLVDPRKSMAIRTASFSSKIRPCLQQRESTSSGKLANFSVQPPKRWKFADASLAYSSLSNLKSNRQPKTPVVKAYEYPPLVFVSLKEAEDYYKSMFSYSHKKSNRLSDVRTASTLQMVSVAETVPHVEGRMSNPPVPTYNVHMMPLEGVIQLAIETSAQVAVDETRTLDNLPSASFGSSPINNSIGSPTVPALPVTPQSTQDYPISSLAPARRASSRANVIKRASIRRGLDISQKTMKPLASFLDESIQNIRNAAATQDKPSVFDKHLPSKRRLRKASRNEYNPRQSDINAMLLQPVPTNFTDMTRGISVSQKAWSNDLESIRQNDFNYRDHMHRRRTLDLPHNQRLSPDILTALEPQNYQVILS